MGGVSPNAREALSNVSRFSSGPELRFSDLDGPAFRALFDKRAGRFGRLILVATNGSRRSAEWICSPRRPNTASSAGASVASPACAAPS
jgi:hypothetical protein